MRSTDDDRFREQIELAGAFVTLTFEKHNVNLAESDTYEELQQLVVGLHGLLAYCLYHLAVAEGTATRDFDETAMRKLREVLLSFQEFDAQL